MNKIILKLVVWLLDDEDIKRFAEKNNRLPSDKELSEESKK